MKKVSCLQRKIRCPYCGHINQVTLSALFGYKTCICNAQWCVLPDRDVIGELRAYNKLYKNKEQLSFVEGSDFYTDQFDSRTPGNTPKIILWIK